MLTAPVIPPVRSGAVWRGRLAGALLVAPVLAMIAVSLMGPSLTVPDTGRDGLWDHALSAPVMVGFTWAFTLVGALGVILGLFAAGHGGRLRWTGVFGLVSCAVLAVLPVAGSTDALSYA